MMKRRDVLRVGAGAIPGLLALSTGAPSWGMEQGQSGTGALKITKVEPFVIRYPKDDTPEDQLVGMTPYGAMTAGKGLWSRLDHDYPAYPKSYIQATLVKVSTNEGIVGWGQCHAPMAPSVHVRVIRDLLAPVIVGQDPRNVSVLWEKMYATQRMRGYGTGFFIQSIAGIDLALWDIFGKSVGLPVCELLGGAFRKRIPTYIWIRGDSSKAYEDSARKANELGYTAMKMGIRSIDQLDNVAAACEAVKGKGQVFVVATGLKLYEAIKIGRELDKLGNVGWLQEPLLPEDLSGYQKLTAEINTPVCYGAFLANRFRFRDIFVSKAVDIINPDICYCGGITESRRICVLADVYGIIWSPHVSMGSPPYMSASMHLSAASGNAVIMESSDQALGPFGNVLLKEPLEYHPGYAVVPERPGLGIEFDEAELAKVRIG